MGFFALLNLSGTGRQLAQNGISRLDNTGVFDGAIDLPETPVPDYDENGYPKDSNVALGDINAESDFVFE